MRLLSLVGLAVVVSLTYLQAYSLGHEDGFNLGVQDERAQQILSGPKCALPKGVK